MESQAYFENIREHIQARLLTAKSEIDLAVAWKWRGNNKKFNTIIGMVKVLLL